MANQSHAIVIGGSMAGLLASRALSNHFDRVTVIERDQLPDGPEYRAGVPQARHAHLLLAQGRLAMESFFPTFAADMRERGVPELDMTGDGALIGMGGWAKRFKSGITSNAISRVTLEWYIRSQLQALENITFIQQAEAKHLIASDDRTTITGVEVESRVDHSTHSYHADLIVDASGRSSKTPEWLQTLGYDAPEETVVNSYLGYTTRWYAQPADRSLGWNFLAIGARPKENNLRAAAALAVEDGQLVVTLAGMNKEYPPTDEAGFLEFARRLVVPTLYETIKTLEPISPIYGYRRTENRWHHYEKLARHPERFIVMGDAYCGFNPIYGQGMAVAALEAQQLDKLLRQTGANNLAGFPARFYRVLAEQVKTPWLLATGEDLRYPHTEGERPNAFTRFLYRYTDQVVKVMPLDAKVATRFMSVTNLLLPPAALFEPGYMLRVLWLSLVGRPEDAEQNAPATPTTQGIREQ